MVLPEVVDDPIEAAIREADNGNYRVAAPTLASAIHGNERAHSYQELASAISYYGLCIAEIEHDLKRAIEYCERAVKLQPDDARHYANLARVFLVAGNRPKAIVALDRGITRFPSDPRLHAIRDGFGYRLSPVLRFLPRRHPLNRFLGRIRYRLVPGRRPVTLPEESQV